MIKILIVWPISNPVYVSDFWRNSWIYEMEAYLVKNTSEEFQIDIFDGGKEGNYEKYLKIIIENSYDVIGCVAPLDSMDGFEKTIEYTRICSEKTCIFAYGLSCFLQPSYFKEKDIDAFAVKGFDFEVAFLSYVLNFKNKTTIEGCCVRDSNNNWIESKGEKYLNASEWEFIRKSSRVGKVIRMTIARGCIGNCSFCCCPILHGISERRKSINETINYLKTLDYVEKDTSIIEFAAPSFTADRKWVIELCNRMREERINIKWRCVTRVDMLDRELVKVMSKAGCYRIGLGLETLTRSEQRNIRKYTKSNKAKEVIDLLREYSIEPLIFLIAGLPDQKFEDFVNTYSIIKEWGGVPRVTAYVDYYTLDFKNVFSVAMESNMTTSSLKKYKSDMRRKYLKCILDTCDYDEIRREKG